MPHDARLGARDASSHATKEAMEMAKMSRDSAPRRDDHGAVEDLAGELEGYTVNFVMLRENVDGRALLKGLPNDECQCPHWGYVSKGRMTFMFGEREEVYEVGEAFYAPPGHCPVSNHPGTEFVMFSPSQELRETEAVMERNLRSMQTG
jgi:mannose-6-phosphate isomerase-like protein (cupin superfamily)